MIHITGTIPRKCIVACSGGVDSIAIAYFLSWTREVTLAHFDHNTVDCSSGKSLVQKFASDHNLNIITSRVSRDRNRKESLEEYWRCERYKFLHSLDYPVITAHTLDDMVESWIFSSIHGRPKLIPYSSRNVIRPFLTTKKLALISYCENHGLNWIEDASNNNLQHSRNRIRHNILPEVLKINPGIYKVVKREFVNKFNELESVKSTVWFRRGYPTTDLS